MNRRPAPLALALATTSAAALILAIATHRPELIVFAAPLLGALASARGHPLPAPVELHAEHPTERCFENETVLVRLHATTDGPYDHLALSAMKAPFLSLSDRKGAFMAFPEWAIRASRWGRYLPQFRVTVRAAGGLLVAEQLIEPVEIRVYPRPAAPLTVALRPDHLPDRIGVHIGRIRGEGVEFHGIRPYTPGDPFNRINWPATVRLGRWHITERLAERATDLVALIDTYPAGDQPSLDLAVHGAAEIVQAALKRGNRAGVLALGGATRWLGPDVGRRQFYRIADAVLDATGQPDARPAGSRLPRGALPPGACVIAFSPLLDARIGLALQDIRHRGHAIIVVDVLRAAPSNTDPLVHRVWRLGRRSLHRDLATLGIPVVPWAEESTLDDTLQRIARRPIPTGRRPPR